MKTWELVKDFQLKMPNLVKEMKASDHHFDETRLSPHHLESDIFTHTMAVTLMAETLQANLLTRIAALTHDFGKPLARSVKTDGEIKKVRFFGHEGLSNFVAIDYLNSLDFLSKEDKVHISKLISLHTYLYQTMKKDKYEIELAQTFLGEKELFKDLITLSQADALGRFAEDEDREFWMKAPEFFAPVTEGIQDARPLRETKGEAIIMIGVPCSGKSTFVRSQKEDYLVLSRDEIVMELGQDKTYNDAYSSVDHEEVHKVYETRRREAVKSGRNLVFDMTHMTEKSRRKSLMGLPKDMKRRAVVFLIGYEEIMRRNEIRAEKESKRIPNYVLLNMMGSFAAPLMSEGFDQIDYILQGDQS